MLCYVEPISTELKNNYDTINHPRFLCNSQYCKKAIQSENAILFVLSGGLKIGKITMLQALAHSRVLHFCTNSEIYYNFAKYHLAKTLLPWKLNFTFFFKYFVFRHFLKDQNFQIKRVYPTFFTLHVNFLFILRQEYLISVSKMFPDSEAAKIIKILISVPWGIK
ncbi:hypothetical protein KUTeg_019017 [Tegillarca granosa]|uniref:Uncharacterized protein n=1 Tax=Tegillarca granosa TaxID=220873 RepID=A0ABQ9EFI8_TEGGR|nr:hypothetical protein KUTeg_019017 [Tegillarca granosa]